MTDVDRLNEWMAQHKLTLYRLAKELGLKYNTLWVMAVKGKSVSDRFVICFIRRYGCDEATRIFQDWLEPIQP